MTESKFTLDSINILHKAIKTGLDSTVHYKGSVKVADNLNYIEGRDGDVVTDTSTQTNYIYTSGRWEPLSKYDTIHHDNERGDDDTHIEPRKIRSNCKHCGGTLVPNLCSELTMCTYCDCANTTFIYPGDPDFLRF